MKSLQSATRLLASGLVLFGLCLSMSAQSQDEKPRNPSDQTTMTGCLEKDTSGNFTLKDEKTGATNMVTGSADLEKHAANHKVTLTGSTKSDATGKAAFVVSKIQHIATSCNAPSQ